MSERGFAVRSNDELLVNTVSNTRRATIVNWLVTERGLLVHVGWSDEEIEMAWQLQRQTDGVLPTVVEVEIREP